MDKSRDGMHTTVTPLDQIEQLMIKGNPTLEILRAAHKNGFPAEIVDISEPEPPSTLVRITAVLAEVVAQLESLPEQDRQKIYDAIPILVAGVCVPRDRQRFQGPRDGRSR